MIPEEKPINSHARLTRGQLKYFSTQTENGKSIFYLNTKTGDISFESIKTFNTSKGLFSYNTEQKMNTAAERHFHIICDRVSKFSKGEVDTFRFSKKDYSTIYDFVNLSLFRSPVTLNYVNRESLGCLIFGPISQDFLVSASLNINDLGYLLNGYRPTLLVNRTNKNLVLPSTSIYASTPLRANNSINEPRFSVVLPISPKAAVILLDKTDFDSLTENGSLSYIEIKESECFFIDYLNIKAFEFERNLSGCFLVGCSRNDLLPYSNKILNVTAR